MGRISFDVPTSADIDELAQNMRPADRDEVFAWMGEDLVKILRHSLAVTVDPIVVRAPEGLLCILGTAPYSLLGDVGSPWMLGTNALDLYPRTLMRVARRYIDEMASAYAVLTNYVDVRNTASLKLLDWLGFTFGEPEPFGVAGLPFRRFEMRKG